MGEKEGKKERRGGSQGGGSIDNLGEFDLEVGRGLHTEWNGREREEGAPLRCLLLLIQKNWGVGKKKKKRLCCEKLCL